MTLFFKKEVQDKRGKILFFSYGKKQVNFVEIKKKFARGGHYHDFESNHVILSGIVRYLEKNLETGLEHSKILKAPCFVVTPQKRPHLLIALEDTLFIEVFDKTYSAVNFPEYRNIVDQRIISE